MSYDLVFLPGGEQTQVDSEGPLWRRVLDGVRPVLAGLTDHASAAVRYEGLDLSATPGLDSAFHLTGPDPDGAFELAHLPTGVEITYRPVEAGVEVPYWTADAGVPAMVESNYQLARVVEQATGLTCDDPQAGSLDDDTWRRDATEVIEQTHRMQLMWSTGNDATVTFR